MTVHIEESLSTPEEDVRPTAPVDGAVPTATSPGDPLVEEDLLVEDVSIDGMCGVY